MSRTRAAKPEAGSASARRRRWNTAWQNEVARVVSRWPGCADGFWAYGDAGGGARPMALSSQVGREHAAHPDRRAEVQAAVVAAAAASQRGVAARVASAAARAGGGCCGGWFVVVVVVVVVGGVGGRCRAYVHARPAHSISPAPGFSVFGARSAWRFPSSDSTRCCVSL